MPRTGQWMPGLWGTIEGGWTCLGKKKVKSHIVVVFTCLKGSHREREVDYSALSKCL